MQKKVLVVDDSALMRRVLSDIINLDNRFHVSKFATNGLEALDLLVQDKEKFDAIILDINMPKMSGLELLEQLESHKIKATVIIVSTVAKEGAKETIRALELGAFDFVTKPDSFLDVKSEKFSNKIIDCLAVATKVDEVAENTTVPLTTLKEKKVKSLEVNITSHTTKDRHSNKANNGKRLVAIACSTGGPKALQRVIPLLTEDLNCSVLIVQHMPEGFTYSLAHRLNEMSKIEVKESEHGDTIKNGVAYIAKGGSQMRLIETENKQQQLSVTVENARNGLKPCADIMFESLVNTNFNDIICVVLTGMGGDGTSGIRQLKEKKNIYVIAQDEATCTVYGMPKVVTESGLVDEIVPIDGIAGAILKNLGVR
jgi:two-component system chemotaxis response regulator CheB